MIILLLPSHVSVIFETATPWLLTLPVYAGVYF